MERLETAPAVAPPWEQRRHRANELRRRWPHTEEMLRLYVALTGVQERASLAALADRPTPADLAGYVAARVMPAIRGATIDAGPFALVEAVRGDAIVSEAAIHRWLAGEAQSPVEDYLARASCAPVLEVLGPVSPLPRASHPGGCPRCGGLPQLSYLGESGELLVTAPRHLLCARCGASWIHERMACPACDERSAARLPIFSDDERFPALRVDACETCRHYLITVDERKDPAAVPVVDELAALPLDLHARERGFAKIAPNLMGI
jgi:FdhE protein